MNTIIINTLIGICAGVAGFIIRMLAEKSKNNVLQIELARKSEEILHLTTRFKEQQDRSNQELSNLNEAWAADKEAALTDLAKLKDAEIAQAKITACPFTVEVTPVVYQTKDSGFFTDSYILESGLQYQLFVSGVPCFEPHTIIDQRSEENSVNHEKIKEMASIAFQAAESYVSIQAASARGFFRLVDPRVQQN